MYPTLICKVLHFSYIRGSTLKVNIFVNLKKRQFRLESNLCFYKDITLGLPTVLVFLKSFFCYRFFSILIAFKF